MVNAVIRAIAFWLLVLSTAEAADAPCGNPCRKPTSWFDFNAFTLKAASPGSTDYGLWQGEWDKESMDLAIRAEIFDGASKSEGQILMIGGRVMATKGVVSKPGYEIDALDTAVLQQQLVLRILGAALPDGIKDLAGIQNVDYFDEHTGIQFATPSAQGFIAPPWHVRGTVNVVAPDTVEYSIALTSGVKGKLREGTSFFEMSYSGHLSKSSSARLDDAVSLEGWNVFGVGVQTKKDGNSTSYDYNAAPTTETYKSVADVRRRLAVEDYPGERDPSKDFTGFWKSKCDDSFGLQIKPYGADGKYSIVFCGPGGCGNADAGRKTFITGDKHFEVVSEDEVIEIDRTGERERHIRCTKDPNPILGSRK